MQALLFNTKPLPRDSQLPVKHIQCGAAIVKYRLKRSRRRSIGLIIDDMGLKVTAPGYASMMQIESALRDKSGWILDKLGQWQDRQKKNQHAHQVLRDGAQIPYLGKNLTLKLMPNNSQTVQLEPMRGWLVIKAQSEDTDRIEKLLNQWLQHQARREFKTRIDQLSLKVRIPLDSWALSGASTRWGSCTARRTIRLNWRLVHFPASVIDYVVAHEMAHLEELNHSTRFWHKVEQLCPDYETPKALLSAHQPNSIPVFS